MNEAHSVDMPNEPLYAKMLIVVLENLQLRVPMLPV
jgi:hypothetical protein